MSILRDQAETRPLQTAQAGRRPVLIHTLTRAFAPLPGRARSARDPDAATARRVWWRLAVLTIGLIAALLLVLGCTTYVTMRNELLNSLKSTVEMRTNGMIQSMQHNPGPYGFHQGGPGGAGPGGGPGPANGSTPQNRMPPRIGDVTFVVATRTLHVIPGNNPDAATTLPDPAAARRVLSGRSSTLWSTQQVNALGPYLIYTVPVRAIPTQNGQVVSGVVQAMISEQQYLHSLQSLLRVLLGVSALGLVAATAISGVLAWRALTPIRLSLRRQRDFVADAAHELRTPLAIQRTALELGMATGGETDQQGTIEQALSQNVHLTRLVDSLSLLARADSGVVILERAPVDLTRLARDTAAGVAILAEERDVQLCVEGEDDIRVLGDAGRLRQLLLILLDNALKFTPDAGTISVRVTRNGNQARLFVRDSGPGIDPVDLPHLFERFYRADKARSGGGTGLGLAIGRWIAEAHGGQITAANAPDGGALFTVMLPLAH